MAYHVSICPVITNSKLIIIANQSSGYDSSFAINELDYESSFSAGTDAIYLSAQKIQLNNSTPVCMTFGQTFVSTMAYQSLEPIKNRWPPVSPSWCWKMDRIRKSKHWVQQSHTNTESEYYNHEPPTQLYHCSFVDNVMSIPNHVSPNCL